MTLCQYCPVEMVYELRVGLNSGSCREVMQKGLMEGISLFFLGVWFFSGGRRPPDQGRMFEKLHRSVKRPSNFHGRQSRARPVGMPLIRLGSDK